MNDRDAWNLLVSTLRAHFPVEASVTDQWLRERGWDPASSDVALNWVEAFADRTTEAVRRRDAKAVQAHTAVLAQAYVAEPDALRVIVDVSYAENLLWDASEDDKAWAWPFIAAEIWQLHADIWGEPE